MRSRRRWTGAGVALVDVYAEPRTFGALYDVAEALTDFDEQFHLFRAAHLKLAQRNLGLKAIGTGGTPMPQLERTLRDLLFPPLWEARDALLARVSGPGRGAAATLRPRERVREDREFHQRDHRGHGGQRRAD